MQRIQKKCSRLGDHYDWSAPVASRTNPVEKGICGYLNRLTQQVRGLNRLARTMAQWSKGTATMFFTVFSCMQPMGWLFPLMTASQHKEKPFETFKKAFRSAGNLQGEATSARSVLTSE
eukprot:9482486-Pyramimonas_sp.AAC.2